MLNTTLASCAPHLWKKYLLLCGVSCGILLISFSVGAAEPSIPWQCTSYTYTEASQEECIEIYSGDQGTKIAELERQLKRQEILISELRDLIDRQPQQVHNFSANPPSYGFGSPLSFRGGGQFGYGSLLGLGLSLLPSVAIVID